jgi:hypothetical protein
MKASELEHLWRRQQPIELSPENIAQIAATVDTVDRKFRRRIWWRDLSEIAVALVVATFFALIGQTWLRWVSVASCLFVVAWFIRSRIIVRPARELPSVIERLKQMIRETEMQIELLRSILWWYLLPCAVGIFAMVLDFSPRFHLPFLSIYGGVGAAMGVAIYWLNQRYVRKVLEPRRENLRHALAELSQQS